MAQQGRAPLISGWGFRRAQMKGWLDFVRLTTQSPKNSPYLFVDYFLGEISITAHSATPSDTLGGGGVTNIAY